MKRLTDYNKASKDFVHYCFILLGQYQRHPEYFEKGMVYPNLEGPYALRCNSKGQLSIVDLSSIPNKTVAHSYNSTKYSQITYVGILLGKYLELLQVNDI